MNTPYNPHSQIFEWISTGRKDITLDIHPECKDEVDNKRRTHGEKGNINKPGTDTGSGDTHSFTNCCTHTENLPLDEVLESVHASNLKKINKTYPIFR